MTDTADRVIMTPLQEYPGYVTSRVVRDLVHVRAAGKEHHTLIGRVTTKLADACIEAGGNAILALSFDSSKSGQDINLVAYGAIVRLDMIPVISERQRRQI